MASQASLYRALASVVRLGARRWVYIKDSIVQHFVNLQQKHDWVSARSERSRARNLLPSRELVISQDDNLLQAIDHSALRVTSNLLAKAVLADERQIVERFSAQTTVPIRNCSRPAVRSPSRIDPTID